ncbi:MAG: hypothetical protein IV090_27475, partial [Candidatus Sericytochromatia bacterium]|nr:hypothetical protein [Candidatus Sericytochromatia bacterium]
AVPWSHIQHIPLAEQVKRNGATVKSWAGLTGEQNLSWDGKQNGQALADGSYRIVAMTEKQRDRANLPKHPTHSVSP